MASMKYIQGNAHQFALRGRHTGGKHVLVNDTAAGGVARSCCRRKRHFSWLPPKRMCVETRRCPKGNKVSWNEVRLDDIIHIGILKVSPMTDLNIHLAPGALCAKAVPGD